MTTPIYKGQCDNQVQAGGEKSVGESTTGSVVIKGKYATLEIYQDTVYARGETYKGKWIILSSVLRGLPGAMATLTLSLVTKGTETSGYPDALETTWEITWQSVEKPLTANPTLVDQGSGTTQTVVDLVAAWKDSPQQRKRNYQVPLNTLTREADPNVDADWEDLPAAGEALKVCQKLAAGIEGYLVFSPVVTKKTKYSTSPAGLSGGCGKIETPAVVPTGDYVYLKNGDTVLEQDDKTWTRTETWQGADSWDTDLYETA
jgi:hypothetical protein